MRPTLDLRRLHHAVTSRIRLLREMCTATLSMPRKQRGPQLSFIVIELDNLIIGALRAFTISTLRRARTVRGTKISVTTSLDEEAEIAAYILSIQNAVRFKNLKSPARIIRQEEPTIRDPKEIEKILVACNASNLPSMQNSLSLNSTMFRDVKLIRHFYAHRNGDTYAKAANSAARMGILSIAHPDEMLHHVIAGRPVPVLEEWLIDAELFFELLME